MIRDREDLFRRASFELYVFLESAGNAGEVGYGEAVAAGDGFRARLDAILATESHLEIAGRHGFLFVNDVRVPVAGEGFAAVTNIVRTLHLAGLRGIDFRAIVSVDRLMQLSRFLHDRQRLVERGVEEDLQWDGDDIQVLPLATPVGPGGPVGALRDTFFREVFLVSKLLEQFDESSLISVEIAKSILHSIVDELLAEKGLLAWLREYAIRDSQQLLHAVQVSIFATLIGAQIGFSKALLKQLGVAAMFHDIGLALGENDCIQAGTDGLLAPEHPIRGLRHLICRESPLSDMLMRTMLVCAQHHQVLPHLDETAWNREGPLLSASIVRVAELFDAEVRQSGASARQALADLDRRAAAGEFPAGLVAALREVLANRSFSAVGS